MRRAIVICAFFAVFGVVGGALAQSAIPVGEKKAVFTGGGFWSIPPPFVDVFWHNMNPIQADGQFHDIGDQYATAIFYTTEEQKTAAEASKDALAKSGKFQKPIATAILPTTKFWPAEEYHQKYYMKNRATYGIYHFGSGRDSYKQRIWGSER